MSRFRLPCCRVRPLRRQTRRHTIGIKNLANLDAPRALNSVQCTVNSETSTAIIRGRYVTVFPDLFPPSSPQLFCETWSVIAQQNTLRGENVTARPLLLWKMSICTCWNLVPFQVVSFLESWVKCYCAVSKIHTASQHSAPAVLCSSSKWWGMLLLSANTWASFHTFSVVIQNYHVLNSQSHILPEDSQFLC